MQDFDEQEANDPVWQLLPRASVTPVHKQFRDSVIARAIPTYQESAPPSAGILQLFSSAPAGWRAAAAAVVIFSVGIASVGSLTSTNTGKLVSELDQDVGIVISYWSDYTTSPSQFAPLEEALATEALDNILRIEDGDSLDDEDLLLLLFPDWELL